VHSLRTTRKPGIDAVTAGTQILKLTKADPLGKWGARKIQEKLKLSGTHIPR
jgi:hypothetical protein